MNSKYQNTIRLVAQVSDTPKNRSALATIAALVHSQLENADGFTVVKSEQVLLVQMTKPNGVEISPKDEAPQTTEPGT